MSAKESCIKSKLSKVDETRRILDIEISEIKVKEEFEKAYNEISKSAHVPGYRAGKAPRDLLEKHYSKEVQDEVFKHLIPSALEEAITEENLSILGYPDIKDVKLSDSKQLKFQAEFDLWPNVDVKKYKGIKIKKRAMLVKDEEIDDYLKSLQNNLARYHSVERPVKLGDYVIADIELFVDGKLVDKKLENQTIFVNDNFIIPPKELEGLNKSDEKDIEVKLPDTYHEKKFAGKTAKFHIKINELKEKTLPDLNDDFAKDAGNFKDLGELKSTVKKELEILKERQTKSEMEETLLDAILKDLNFDVPKNMVARQTEHLMHEAKERLFKQGFNKEEIDKRDSEFRDKFKGQALKQVKVFFILNDIAEKEKIVVTDSDIDQAFENISKMSRQPKEQILKYYQENNLIERMAEDLKEEKTIEFLLKEANIEETL